MPIAHISSVPKPYPALQGTVHLWTFCELCSQTMVNIASALQPPPPPSSRLLWPGPAILTQEAKYVERWPNMTSAWAGWSRFDIPVDRYGGVHSLLICTSSPLVFPTCHQASQQENTYCTKYQKADQASTLVTLWFLPFWAQYADPLPPVAGRIEYCNALWKQEGTRSYLPEPQPFSHKRGWEPGVNRWSKTGGGKFVSFNHKPPPLPPVWIE
jgi:hypothetical protein